MVISYAWCDRANRIRYVNVLYSAHVLLCQIITAELCEPLKGACISLRLNQSILLDAIGPIELDMYQVVQKKNVTQKTRSKSARNKDNNLKIDDSIAE